MFGGSISFVVSKAISGKLAIAVDHDGVAGDFGDDGGGRDVRAFAVSADHAGL